MKEFLSLSSPNGIIHYSEFRDVLIRTLPTTDGRFSLGIDIVTFEGQRNLNEGRKYQKAYNGRWINSTEMLLFKLEYGKISNQDLESQKLKIKNGGCEDSGGLLNIITDKSIRLVNASISFKKNEEGLFVICTAFVNPSTSHKVISKNSKLDLVAKVNSLRNFETKDDLLLSARRDVVNEVRYNRVINKLKGEEVITLKGQKGYEKLPNDIQPLNREFVYEDSKYAWDFVLKFDEEETDSIIKG